jgi:putative ABC transport system ATP-binding protein
MESGLAAAAAPPALDIDALQFLRGTRKVIDLPSLSLAAGEHCAVLGPSGCGKSTLLHLVAGLLTPAHGTIRVAGQDLHAMSSASRDRFRGRHIGIVFQRLHLLPSLTLLQNLQIAGRLAGTKEDRERLDTLLSSLGIRDRMHAHPSALSQGEMQRAAIARAVIQRPALVLADEPTSSLDDGNAARVMDLLLAQTTACGAALLVVTHDARVRDRFPRHLTLEARP